MIGHPVRLPESRPAVDWWLVTLLVLAASVRLWLGPHLVDDAYITFRYARNLAAGLGFVYNPGEAVLGTSTPLFTLLLGAVARFGLSIPWTAVAFGILGDLLLIIVVYRLLRRSRLPLQAGIAGLLLAILPLYVFHSMSGMETSLYNALIALAIEAFAAEKPRWLGIWLGLTALMRPEGFLLAFVFWLYRIGIQKRLPWQEVLPFALIVLPWGLYSWYAFGSLIPSSVSTKAVVHAGDWHLSFHNWLSFFGGTRLHLVLSGLALVGLVTASRNRVWLGLWTVWGSLYSALFVAGNAFHYYYWYFAPLVPLYLTLAACGAGAALSVTDKAILHFRIPRPDLFHTATLIVLMAAGSIAAFHRLSVQDAASQERSQGREVLYRKVAFSLSQRSGTRPLLAASEVGVIGYYYLGPVLDLVGLISPQVVGHSDLEKIATARPFWIVSYDTHIDPALLRSPEFILRYELVRREAVGSGRRLLVFRRRLQPILRQPSTLRPDSPSSLPTPGGAAA